MRALSIRQPWAWFIVDGAKPIENRSWSTDYRGPFLVHASKGMSRREYDEALEFVSLCVEGGRELADRAPDARALARGGIVGVSEVVDCRPCSSSPLDADDWELDHGYALVLGSSAELPFVPCSGTLGFWDAGAELVSQLGLGLLVEHRSKDGYDWEPSMFNRERREALGAPLVETRRPFKDADQYYEWRPTPFGRRVAAAWSAADAAWRNCAKAATWRARDERV